MRKTVLPLPSVCVHCGVTIKAKFVREGRSAEFVWVHDAPLGVNIAKGGPHASEPDPRVQASPVSRHRGRPRCRPAARLRGEHGRMSVPLSTIEDKRKSLAFLETLANPSDTVISMIREFRAEIAAAESHMRRKRCPDEFAKH